MRIATFQDLRVDPLAMSFLHQSLVVDLGGGIEKLDIAVNQSFFTNSIYWLLPNSANVTSVSNNLQFDSQVYTVDQEGGLHEWYMISTLTSSKLAKGRFGTFTHGELKVPESIWERRNLGGAVLNVTYVWHPEYFTTETDRPVLLQEILSKMESMSNFTSIWGSPKDNEFGRMDKNGTWYSSPLYI